MSRLSLEKKFAVLSEIVRAQHFAWRDAVCLTCPERNPTEVTLAMWRRSGRETAASYARRIDPSQPLAPQVAASIVFSSESMGETASVEVADEGERDEAFVRHTACPWLEWHERKGLLEEDRPGCDIWFGTVAEELGRSLGCRLEVQTLESMPDGDASCLRRLWVEGDKSR